MSSKKKAGVAAAEALPVPPHLTSEFYAWLWWSSEAREGVFDLGGEAGRVEVWLDDRLAFRNPNDNKVSALMTGENPSQTLEARAALAGGKVLQDLRIGLRRDDREFSVTLKGAVIDLQRAKLPQAVEGSGEESLYDRIFLYEELSFVLGALFRAFSDVRASDAWQDEVLPSIRQWVAGMA
jgi:hypothetical protein